MSINFKKNIVWSCALATAFALSACGDDSSSSPNQEIDNPSSSSTENSTINSSSSPNQEINNPSSSSAGGTTNSSSDNRTGNNKDSGNSSSDSSNDSSASNSEDKDSLPAEFDGMRKVSLGLKVNEATKTITMTHPGQENKACVINTDQNVEWKSVPEDVLALTLMYDFVGDTLVLYNWDNYDKEFDTEGVMYVGGSAGSLYGTWKYTPCEYDSELGKSKCYDRDSNFDAVVTFSEKSATIVEKTRLGEFNYATSKFRQYLLTSLDDESDVFIPFAEYLLYTADEDVTFASIEESNLTKTGETFKYKGTTYTVNVPTYKLDGYYAKLSVEVASAEKKCTNIYEESALVTEDLCIDENYENFDIEIYEGKNGNSFRYADYFEKDNDNEFEACVMDLFGIEDDDYDDEDNGALFKKASKSKTNHSRNLFFKPSK